MSRACSENKERLGTNNNKTNAIYENINEDTSYVKNQSETHIITQIEQSKWLNGDLKTEHKKATSRTRLCTSTGNYSQVLV